MADKKECLNVSNKDKLEESNDSWKFYSCLGYAAVMLLVGIPIW